MNRKDAAKDPEAKLLYTDHHILNECKTRWENLGMVWIDKKGIWYDSAKLDNELA